MKNEDLTQVQPEPVGAKTPKKRIGVDGAIITIACMMLLGSAYYLLMDSAGSDTAGKTPVGQFTRHDNDVRRRMQDGFEWSNVSKSDSVYEGDSVFTGDASSADIGLKSGGHLSIDPKSLVVIHTSGNGLQLDLQYGSMTGKVPDGVALIVAQDGVLQELSGKGAEIRISSGKDKKSKIEVLSGDVDLKPVKKTKTAVKQTLHKNDVVHLDAPPPAKKVALELLGPNPGQILWLADHSPVRFSWKAPETAPEKVKDTTYRFETSVDAAFTAPLFSSEVSDSSFELAAENHPTGQPFYWHVLPVAKSGATDKAGPNILPSRAARLTVYPDVPPTLVAPAQDQTFDLVYDKKTTPGVRAELAWTDIAGSSSYEVQVAQDEAFTQPIYKTHVVAAKNLKISTNPLGAGTYYWRVMGLHEQRKNAPWSLMSKFSVRENIKTLPAPVLKDLQLTYVIPPAVLKHTPAAILKSGAGIPVDKVPPVTWQPVTGAETYEVEIALNDKFVNSARFPLGNTKSFAPAQVQPGPLFARIRAKADHCADSAPSLTAKLNVLLPAPVLKPIDPVTEVFPDKKSYDLGHHEFNVTWSPVPFADHYEFDRAIDKTFKKGKRFKAKDAREDVKANQSVRELARVRAVDKFGSPISDFSEVQTVSYTKKLLAPVAVATPAPVPVATPPPAAVAQQQTRQPERRPTSTGLGPKLKEPIEGTSLFTSEGATPFVNFRWAKFAGADSYEVQVAQDPSFTTVLESKTVRHTAFVYAKSLPEGSVYWRVRGKTNQRVSDWSNANLLLVHSR